MDTLVIVGLLIMVYFFSESGLRKGSNAKSLIAGESDQQTSLRIAVTFGVATLAILLSPLLNSYQIGAINGLSILRWSGVGIALIGLAIRTWAMRVLGQFYTRTLRTTSDQQIVRQGPYRLIRHPGYLGSLLLWIGAALGTGNWIVAGGIALAFAFTYRTRILAEEAMLIATFGQAYTDYSRQTWKLIPFLF